MSRILVGLSIVLSLVSVHSAQGTGSFRNPASILSMDACGDSITTGFNAQSSFPCPNADQEQYNYATSDTSGGDACAPGPEGVFSHAERIKCLRGASIVSASPNSAESGARMLDDFVGQANSVYARLTAQPAPRYVPVLLGQNDVCGGLLFKFHLSCPRGSDQDRNDYCRTTPGAFERELRRGLDVLMSIPDTHVGVASLVRVSQLCNHAGKRNCQTFTSCGDLWRTAAFAGLFFGQRSGICGSMTSSCADGRIADAYRSAKIYRDILMRVTHEYAAIPPGDPSRIVVVGGQTVGGGFKADAVTIAYSDVPWRYRFTSGELSCCDCYHPSVAGQNATSAFLFNGLRCTPERPCCADTGDAVADGKCTAAITDGRYLPGLFPPPATN
jgi:hypothetical protein